MVRIISNFSWRVSKSLGIGQRRWESGFFCKWSLWVSWLGVQSHKFLNRRIVLDLTLQDVLRRSLFPIFYRTYWLLQKSRTNRTFYLNFVSIAPPSLFTGTPPLKFKKKGVSIEISSCYLRWCQVSNDWVWFRTKEEIPYRQVYEIGRKMGNGFYHQYFVEGFWFF